LRWFRPLVALVISVGAVVSARGQAEDAAGSPELSLEEELARLKAEVLRGAPTDDPFAEGRVPDLVVLSVTDVAGEIAPCG
jgi:hypothetical protein